MPLTDIPSRTAALTSIRDRLFAQGGLVELFGGAVPAALDEDLSERPVLASRPLIESNLLLPVGATMHGQFNPGDFWTALQDGLATFYRVRLNDGTPLILGTVGSGVNFDMRVVNPAFVQGQEVRVTGWVVELSD